MCDNLNRFGFQTTRALIPYNLYAALCGPGDCLEADSSARRRRHPHCRRIQPRATPGQHLRHSRRAAPPHRLHPGHRNPRAEGRTHGLVAAGALRHVHPLGPLLHPRRHMGRQANPQHRRVDHEQRIHPRGRLQGPRRRSSIPPASARTISSRWPNPPA